MVAIDQVLEKLSTVIDPDLKKDIVSMGMIKDLELNDGNLKFTLELTTPACPFNVEIEDDVRKVIAELSDLKNFDLNVTAKVMEGRSLEADTQMATVKNIIGVASGKGGVGKSTVSLNLALALSQTGAKVGLLDADIYGPSIPLMLGMEDGSMEVEDNKLQPADVNGLKVVSFGFFADQSKQAAIYRGPIISGILKQFLVDTNWSELDYLIVDLPPGTGDIHLSIMQSLPISGAIIVSTPQVVALSDARKGVSMFKKENINVPVLGLIENMSYFTPLELPKNKYYLFGKDGAKNLASDLKIPFLGDLPIIQSIREAGDFGRPASMQDDTISENIFNEISKNMLSQLVIRNKELPETEIIKITTMSGCSAKK